MLWKYEYSWLGEKNVPFLYFIASSLLSRCNYSATFSFCDSNAFRRWIGSCDNILKNAVWRLFAAAKSIHWGRQEFSLFRYGNPTLERHVGDSSCCSSDCFGKRNVTSSVCAAGFSKTRNITFKYFTSDKAAVHILYKTSFAKKG